MDRPSFGKHPDFIVRQEDPFNGGPPLRLLAQSGLTPADLFFVRSHGRVPEPDASRYRLEVGGDVPQPLSLSLEDIRKEFPRFTLPVTLQCAGNRRQDLMDLRPIPGEVAWGSEAISTARWTGVRLRDVLAAAGAGDQAEPHLHAAFEGLDQVERHGQRFPFGGSIPLEKALRPEVLLAFEMDGEPLAPAHGFPLRVVAPGYIGARSIKWLGRIQLQGEPSHNYFQRQAYRLFPPQVSPETVHWDEGLMLGEMSLTSAICSPAQGDRLPAGLVTVVGYALAGGGRQVARVDISADGGYTWQPAELSQDPQPWAWRLWRIRLDLQPGRYQLVARAVDSAANSQPPDAEQTWNFKGYMNNAWHRVSIKVEP